MTIEHAIQKYVSERKHLVSPKTHQHHRQRLKAFTEYMPNKEIPEVTLGDLRQWRTFLFERSEICRGGKMVPGKLSTWTIRGMLVEVKTFFTWLTREGYLTENPSARLELPAQPDQTRKGIQENDIILLLQAAQREDSPTRRLRNVAILLFLRDTGCRVGGVVGLRLEDLSLDKRRALVTEKGSAGGKTRIVFFTEETQRALYEWLQLHPAFAFRRAVRENGAEEVKAEHVFVSERYPYAPLSKSSFSCVLARLRVLAGITGRSNPHSFRHRRAISMLENGAPLGLVKRILGHADIRTTDQYYGNYGTAEQQAGFEKYA